MLCHYILSVCGARLYGDESKTRCLAKGDLSVTLRPVE